MNRLTREQAAVIGAYTGILAGPVSDMHDYIRRIMKRPVFTHELADDAVAEQIRAAAKPDFLAICHSTTAEGKQ